MIFTQNFFRGVPITNFGSSPILILVNNLGKVYLWLSSLPIFNLGRPGNNLWEGYHMVAEACMNDVHLGSNPETGGKPNGRQE